MAEASTALKSMFLGLGVVLGIAFVTAVHAAWRRTGGSPFDVRRATLFALAGAVAWLGGTWLLAASGRLSFEGVPPTMVPVIGLMLATAVILGVAAPGRRLAAGLPLWLLVGVQAFRLPLELMMHRAYAEGVMPVQMSFAGWNFDIVTGITAIVVAAGLATGWLGLRAAAAWNVLGTALLIAIIAIAFLSTPLPIRVFMNEPANVWITQPPFIWLPAVMVFMAVLGHIVVLRRLRLERRAAPAAVAPARVQNA
jgi:hypothetical protein